jgi:hypothetical protein
MGILGILVFIANKMAIVNDISHEIRDILLKGGNPPPPTTPTPITPQ